MSPLRASPSQCHSQGEPTIRERLEKLNVTSSREAAALAAQGRKARLWQVSFAPPLAFLRSYFWRGEWRRGIAGLVTALFVAYEVFVRYAKLWEIDHSKPVPSSPQAGNGPQDPTTGADESQ
jgi:hypothetical protein